MPGAAQPGTGTEAAKIKGLEAQIRELEKKSQQIDLMAAQVQKLQWQLDQFMAL
jgi:hypothetical protein